MMSRTSHQGLLVVAALVLLLVPANRLPAQGQGGGGAGGGGIGGGGIGGGGGNTGGGNVAGIFIDPHGVIHPQTLQPASAKLLRERQEAFAQAIPGDLQSYSERRMVSLVGLERICATLMERGEEPGEEHKSLGGLQRIDYLFVDEDSGDLVIAGPAEGFVPDLSGRMIGVTTGRPTLRLDDLIVALQGGLSGVRSMGCSIDPEPGRLARMQQYVRANSSPTSPAGAARRYEQMANILGRQQVSVFGVEPATHFAQVLVEADFRMKRISLGAEPSGVRGLSSHLALLKPNGNSIQRWWFTPLYEGLYASPDRSAFQLVGQRVQLMAQEEVVGFQGERSDAAFTRTSTERFAQNFTLKYPELAERSPIFAELQNLIDLAVIAALIRQEQLAQRVGWTLTLFADATSALVPEFPVPREVDSETTSRRASRGMILGLVGGVTINPRSIIKEVQTADPSLRLEGVQTEVRDRPRSEVHSWWWD